ncbi:MAG: alpha-amylase family glycosyl hydrolase [Oscillospiraceae bacterium]|nr:alpha-amylase family glycosyl hydrolase [Oscillospiraceae bacterium]
MKKKIALFLAACTTVLSACRNNVKTVQESLTWQERLSVEMVGDALAGEVPSPADRPDENGRTWYQVFVYSFCDSDGDGIGDLNGVTERLDYIAYTGFDGIWLSPIHTSATYHKYDVDDYYSIDPAYGTMEDFEQLVSACRERGIKLILDLVINHTSIDHPWFKNNPEYYNILDAPGNGNWKALPDGRYYECQFWDRMPDLNLESVEVRAELEKVFEFWLNKGVDGFRLDAVGEYISGNTAKNIEVLTWINDAVKGIKPNAYLVGEFWNTTDAVYLYYQSGADSFFAFPFAGADGIIARTLLRDLSAAGYLNRVVSAQNTILENNPNGTAAPFFTNHDMARASGFLRRDGNLIKTAWGMSLMQPGDAFVYYGEELAMSGSGKDENKRVPMLWTADETARGMTAGPPAMDSVSHSFPPAIEQIGDEDSVYSYIRKAVLLRAKYPSIGRGDIKVLELSLSGDAAENAGAVSRTWNGETIFIYYNISSETLNLPSQGQLTDYLSATGSAVIQGDSELLLPGYTIAITK